jgi:hypothetical protein
MFTFDEVKEYIHIQLKNDNELSILVDVDKEKEESDSRKNIKKLYEGLEKTRTEKINLILKLFDIGSDGEKTKGKISIDTTSEDKIKFNRGILKLSFDISSADVIENIPIYYK